MIVKGYGHSEEEIREELKNIQNGELWTGFDNLPNFGADNKKTNKD